MTQSLPIVLHVNYVEQGQGIEEMCRLAAAWGYEGIEFRRRMAGKSAQQYVEEVAAAAQKHKLKHVLFGGPGVDLMQADADARRRELDDAAAFYRLAAQRIALTVCNTMAGPLVSAKEANLDFDKNGSAFAREEHWQQAVEGFQMLGDLAAELGFRLAFETHMNYLHDLPEPSRKLVDRIARPAVGLNLDYGNMQLFGAPPPLPQAVQTVAPRLFMVHLKNYYLVPGHTSRHFIACPLADGVINHREYLRQLKAAQFNGPIVIEAPRSGDREWFARQDLAYFKQLRDEVG